ncbi:ArnT family glycosyltransferase [Methanobacterium sp.]|uniref:ArnT family glycosyltransferase n=1 Tax=Methanobacterium sp. TaxID=2164 RepID=UPI002AB9D444|nr:glycosyltransferase family 39 protein [Methanobacterium sp.]MDY9923542.1 glycosyltransferase family 39 protein [Methanobacterium sp.]
MQEKIKSLISKDNSMGDMAISLLLVLLVLITRLPFTSKFLYEWDSVNFALALDKYDILLHQPQPPGYILFVGLGKVLNQIIHDANTTLIFMSILFSALTVILLYFLGKQLFSRNIAITGAIILIFSPIFWFYGEIATIYPSEAFLAMLIAYTSYQAFKGRKIFFYLSSLALGLAGGFRQDLIPFMFPLWLFCLFYPERDYKQMMKRMITAFGVLAASILLWLVPSIILAGGLESYLSAGGHFSASFKTSSVIFGALPSNHLLMDGMLASWLMIGLGFIGGILILLFVFTRRKTILNSKILKNPKFIFMSLWILPSFLFLVFIPLSKPGYTLTFLPALTLILGYVFINFSRDIGLKFNISSKSVCSAILIIYIVLNSFYFLYPYNLNEESTWETQISNMNSTEKIILGVDMFFMYNNEKIVINDRNMDWHLEIIENLSNLNPNNTQIIIRDIIREDQGFSWRKAMYQLPEYDVYYLFDSDNSQLKSNKLNNQVSYSYGKNHTSTSSQSSVLEIPINSSTEKIVWIMDDRSQFFQELQSQIEIKTIQLPNGLNVYYSDVKDKKMDLEIGGFIFRTVNSSN